MNRGHHLRSSASDGDGYGRDGSFATKPSHASSYQCPLLSKSGQNVAVPRLSAKCQKRSFPMQRHDTVEAAGSKLDGSNGAGMSPTVRTTVVDHHVYRSFPVPV